MSSARAWGIDAVVRGDLVQAKANREARRTALASFVQFSDMHICDAQSPLRFEYLHPIMGSGAHRPQETLTAQVAEAIKIGGYWNSGQDCTASSRILVHERIYDDVMSETVETLEAKRSHASRRSASWPGWRPPG